MRRRRRRLVTAAAAAAAAIDREFTIQGGLGPALATKVMRRHWSTTGAAAAVPTRRRNPFRHRWSRPRADGEGDVAVALSLSRWLMRALARLGRGLQPGRLAACRERCVQTWCIIENLKVLRCVSCVFVSSTLGLRACVVSRRGAWSSYVLSTFRSQVRGDWCLEVWSLNAPTASAT